MQEANVDGKPIKDKYNLVYLILLLHGVGILMPWNMFITPRSYFVDYKLSKNYTGEDSRYMTYFLSYVGFASQIPIIIFNWINIFINIGVPNNSMSLYMRWCLAIHIARELYFKITVKIYKWWDSFAEGLGEMFYYLQKLFEYCFILFWFLPRFGSVPLRIVLSLSVEIFMFIITIILAIANTSHWLTGFFWSTMVCIVILNMANGIYQNTIFGIAAKLPFRYTGVVLLGCNVSGALVSFIDLLTIISAPSIETAAICYFTASLIVLLSCLLTYFILPSTKFYRHFKLMSIKSIERINADCTTKIPYRRILKKASSQLFNIFFIFFVTLSIFPAMQADIKKSDPDFIIPGKYYDNIMCFLTFNITAVLGCLLSNWIKWPSPKLLLIPVLLRGLCIPFFFFCNYQPINKERRMPVLIPNDWMYWSAGIFLGFTSGYLSSKAMIYTTESVETTYASISGMFGAAVIVTGIFSGVLFSMIFPWLSEI